MYHYCQNNDENILSYLSPILNVAIIEPWSRNVERNFFLIFQYQKSWEFFWKIEKKMDASKKDSPCKFCIS